MAEIFEEINLGLGINQSWNIDPPVTPIETQEYGDSFFQSQTFEIKEDTKYNDVTYMVVEAETNKLVKTYNSTDGSFNIQDLIDNIKYNIIVIDNTKKYTGKYIDNIVPQVDDTKKTNVIKLYEKRENGVYTAGFKIHYLGQPQINLAAAPAYLSLIKADDTTYTVKGNTTDKVIKYELVLDDYREDKLVQKIKQIEYKNYL